MNDEFYSNKSEKTKNTTDYCKLLTSKSKSDSQFDKQKAKLQKLIDKYSGFTNPVNLSSVIAFAQKLYGDIQTLLAEAQAEYAKLLVEQAKITKELNDKIAEEGDKLKKKIPGIDLSKICPGPDAKNKATSATTAKPVGDRDPSST